MPDRTTTIAESKNACSSKRTPTHDWICKSPGMAAREQNLFFVIFFFSCRNASCLWVSSSSLFLSSSRLWSPGREKRRILTITEKGCSRSRRKWVRGIGLVEKESKDWRSHGRASLGVDYWRRKACLIMLEIERERVGMGVRRRKQMRYAFADREGVRDIGVGGERAGCCCFVLSFICLGLLLIRVSPGLKRDVEEGILCFLAESVFGIRVEENMRQDLFPASAKVREAVHITGLLIPDVYTGRRRFNSRFLVLLTFRRSWIKFFARWDRDIKQFLLPVLDKMKPCRLNMLLCFFYVSCFTFIVCFFAYLG